jgi:2-oxoglutarate ferredoxin oxidoreductase subunit beta
MADKPLFQRPRTLQSRSMPYCPGCGHGHAHVILSGVIDELGIRETTVGIAPVGCAVEAYHFLDLDMTEAAHGRAPAVATGIKRSRPDLTVFTYQGDGDLASIGLAEILHAANRGENFTTIFINNTLYGMTGGQLAPTTLVNQKTQTSQQGRDPKTMGHPMRICEMIAQLESPYYVVRCALDKPAGIRQARQAIRRAFEYQIAGRGFTFVELLSACPTYWRLPPKEALEHIGAALVPVYPLRVFRDRGAQA